MNGFIGGFVLQRVSKESMECKELPNYFTLGPEKFLLDARQTEKVFEKIQGIRHLVLAECGLH